MDLSKHESWAWAALRIVAGFMFSLHGMQKMFGWFGGSPVPFGGQIWFAAAIELVCGVLVAVGLFTRWAALLASGEMAVAYFQAHFKLDFSGGRWLPIINKGELAA